MRQQVVDIIVNLYRAVKARDHPHVMSLLRDDFVIHAHVQYLGPAEGPDNKFLPPGIEATTQSPD